MRRRRKNEIISYILAFILMLSLIGISLLSIGKYSMLSVHGVMHTCDRIEYYEAICKEMKTEAYHIGIPYGITKKCLKGVFKQKKVESDMREVLISQIDGEKYTVNTEQIGKKIAENVEKQLGSLNEKEKESLQAYIVQVGAMYQKKMIIPSSGYIANMINVWSKAVLIGVPICILIAILSVFFLVSIRKYYYHGLRFVAYATLGAGITLLTVFAAFISDGDIYKFNISDVYMRKFFTYFIGHEMLMQVFAGIGMLVAGVVMVYVVFRQKVRLNR